MVPAPDTRDAILSIIDKILNEHRSKNRKVEWKTAFWSTSALFEVGLPLIFFALALISGGIYRWVHRADWLGLISYILILLIFVSVSIGGCIDAARVFNPRRVVNSILEKIRKRIDTDAPHITELSKHSWQDLEYVLVEVKAERAALERRTGLLVGALEKIGLVPSTIAAFAALARLPGGLSSPWIQGIAYGTPLLYFSGIFTYERMIEFDRVIMLLESIIDTNKSEEDNPNKTLDLVC